MLFLIYILTAAMVFDCLVLILLVLMQLPKKEAGAGLAFGGAATDALFGAGSGNFLTKATKYAASIFFALAVLLAVMQNSYYNRNREDFRRQVGQQQGQGALPGQPAGGVAPPASGNAPAQGKPQAEANEAAPAPANSTPAPSAPPTEPATPPSTPPQP